METWNERFKEALEGSEYTANALARKLSVSAPTVSAWAAMAGVNPAKNITAENLLKACDLLGVRPDWVLWKRGAKLKKDGEGITAKTADFEAPVYPDFFESPSALQIDAKQIDQFVADLREAFGTGRLTPRRFALLQGLLSEGATSTPVSIENQRIATRGGDGRHKQHRRKTGT